jgi:hypothetical protein
MTQSMINRIDDRAMFPPKVEETRQPSVTLQLVGCKVNDTSRVEDGSFKIAEFLVDRRA